LKRVPLPDIQGRQRETDGIQGSPAHGLAITNDGKTLWATSKYYDYVAALSLPDLTVIKTVDVGLHPEWLTIPPNSNSLYVAVAGKNATVVVDTKTMAVIATVPVGQVPKRNGSGMLQTQ
jgi:YVTN family beta-propeller protein